MKLTIEKELSRDDKRVVNAFTHYFSLYPEDDLEDVADTFLKCNFDNHIVGRGGSHIWIARKEDNERIAIITAN